MEIRTIRLNKGLTQSEDAALVGLTLRTYQNYESGNSFRDTFKKNNIIRIDDLVNNKDFLEEILLTEEKIYG